MVKEISELIKGIGRNSVSTLIRLLYPGAID